MTKTAKELLEELDQNKDKLNLEEFNRTFTPIEEQPIDAQQE